ncbi:MAG: ferrochelatase [Pelagibacteraceae bacterium]|jgi:ferrochelatase|nr:ferrochelatase [Pelagibacteraceae bacterium]MBO6492534.1 ferrochelatase [Pelagibacteraceae bacterium]
MKKAVILFNLGGPDKLESVEPFLFNLFNDPAIINIPSIFRYPLAKFISKKRAPVAKNIYKEIGNKSPILELTQDQAKSLENNLSIKGDYKCFVVMRYWHPRALNVIKKVREYNPEEIILLPLYPQYSASTSGSSINEWSDLCKKENYHVKTKTICCYPTENNFIASHVLLIKKTLKVIEDNNFKLIFSAHGLPKNKIKKGDPYQWQVEETVKKIMSSLESENLNYIISYQSRVGPSKWIGPSAEEVIIKYSKEKKGIVIVPIAFVSEHSETLVELDIEYKKLAEKNGCGFYKRVPALGIEENFIKGLTELVLKQETRGNFVSSLMCPNKYVKCPCLEL